MAGSIYALLFVLLLVISGVLITPPQEKFQKRWRKSLLFLEAVSVAIGMAIIGYIIFALLLIIIVPLHVISGIKIGLFAESALLIGVCGLLLFALLIRVKRKLQITDIQLTTIEYYIQWSLIYITVYQVVFAELRGADELSLQKLSENVLDPASTIIIVLPVLMSVWVAIALVKLRARYHRERVSTSA